MSLLNYPNQGDEEAINPTSMDFGLTKHILNRMLLSDTTLNSTFNSTSNPTLPITNNDDKQFLGISSDVAPSVQIMIFIVAMTTIVLLICSCTICYVAKQNRKKAEYEWTNRQSIFSISGEMTPYLNDANNDGKQSNAQQDDNYHDDNDDNDHDDNVTKPIDENIVELIEESKNDEKEQESVSKEKEITLEIDTKDSDIILPPNWRELHTEDGKPYYHNTATNETQWEIPIGKPIETITL